MMAANSFFRYAAQQANLLALPGVVDFDISKHFVKFWQRND